MRFISKVFAVLPTGAPNGWIELYAKFGQPPGWRFGQYDVRPEWDYYSDTDDDAELSIDRNNDNFQPGTCIASSSSSNVGSHHH